VLGEDPLDRDGPVDRLVGHEPPPLGFEEDPLVVAAPLPDPVRDRRRGSLAALAEELDEPVPVEVAAVEEDRPQPDADPGAGQRPLDPETLLELEARDQPGLDRALAERKGIRWRGRPGVHDRDRRAASAGSARPTVTDSTHSGSWSTTRIPPASGR